MRFQVLLILAQTLLVAKGVWRTSSPRTFWSPLNAQRPKQNPESFWPTARGPTPGQFGTTKITPPLNLSEARAWHWQHPDGQYHTTVAGGPVIDVSKNLYITTSDGLRKISPDGDTLWHFTPPGDINNMPALYGSYVYGAGSDGHVFALDQETGEQVWLVRPSTSAGGDSGYPSVYDGLFIVGTQAGPMGGNQRMVALNSSTGEQVWEYHPATIVWNVMPLFPGDGTVVFMDDTGGLYRLGLHNGSSIWYTAPANSTSSFSDGGAILGPDYNVYTCSNPANETGNEGTGGVLRSFRLEDGAVRWNQSLPQPCNSWPVVGHLGGSKDLSVVVTPGSFMGTEVMHGGIMAFDAATGMPQWQYQAPLYHAPEGFPLQLAAYGDYQGFPTRLIYNPAHMICLPAHWSCPTILGDGSVIAGRADGKLYRVIAPPTGDSGIFTNLANVAQAEELSIDYNTSAGVKVEVYDPKGASLHGAAAFAPGMMAFATCDTIHVFKF